MKTKGLLLCIGNAGMKVVEQFEKEGGAAKASWSTLAIGIDKIDLGKTSIKHRVQIGVKTCEGSTAFATFETGRQAMQEQISEVLKEIGDHHNVMLVAGFGSVSATGATLELVNTLKDRSRNVGCLVIKPLDVESPSRQLSFYNGVASLENDGIPNLIFDINDFMPLLESPNIKFDDVYKLMDELMVCEIEDMFDFVSTLSL